MSFFSSDYSFLISPCLLKSLNDSTLISLIQGVVIIVAGQNWGQADSFIYDCCLICVDASVPQLDGHVDSRVDSMVAAGLLDDVFDIYNPNANYTRGLRQAIGVREFQEFLRYRVPKGRCNEDSDGLSPKSSIGECTEILKENMRLILNSSSDGQSSLLMKEAIDNVKLNTRRLVRRQVCEYLSIKLPFFFSFSFST